ncbi:MAG TPA: general secretion pathway protein [Gammaproteobacteria bacterium]|nr:general secretion pathway protein [Gammaproteobacteria bacterium]HAU06908.1 general secretion pathway protein [Gammaproteobacteria bacterium]
MYCPFFQFDKRPFPTCLHSDRLFLSPDHQKGLTLIEYGLTSEAEIMILTGEVGTGKTLLGQHLRQRASSNQTIGMINQPHPVFGHLMAWLLHAFDIEATDNPQHAWQSFLVEQQEQGLTLLLIIDEAHHLSNELLEALRLLLNINNDKQLTLQILLLGQPQLQQHIAQPALTALHQRIYLRHHLSPLSYLNTEKYITHQLLAVGSRQRIFSYHAIMAIFYYSQGIPRKINQLCDFCLTYAYAKAHITVDIETVLEVVQAQQGFEISHHTIEAQAIQQQIQQQLHVQL